MKIIFAGTPEFAVPSLEKLIDSKYCIQAVITQPDRPGGRGRALRKPPVKIEAEKSNIPVLQPENINNKEFLDKLTDYKPHIIATAAYGQIFKKQLLELPCQGCINIHASLLPKYRGSSPIQWSIINGEKVTGVTIMYIDEGLDTGDIILQREIGINKHETAGQLHDRLSVLGSDALMEALKLIEDKKVNRQQQKHDEHTYFPMINKSMGHIKWEDDAVKICNLIHGLTPWPGTYTFYEGKRIKLWSVDVIHENCSYENGKIVSINPEKGIIVCAGRGKIVIKELQMENGKRMNIQQFLRGNSMKEGVILK